jgi:uncharacterized protein YjbI with pentapeptide repeats
MKTLDEKALIEAIMQYELFMSSGRLQGKVVSQDYLDSTLIENIVFPELSNSLYYIQGALFRNVVFNKNNFNKVCFNSSAFEACLFDYCELKKCDFIKVVAKNSIFNQCDFLYSNLSYSSFNQCLFIDCKLDGLITVNTKMENCIIIGTNKDKLINIDIGNSLVL